MAQINLGGSVGVPGSVSVLGNYNVIFTTDGNHTLTATEWSNQFLELTSSVPLTVGRQLIAPLIQGQCFIVQNNTTGSQSVTVIGTSGAGATIPTGGTSIIVCDGSNYIDLPITNSGAQPNFVLYPGNFASWSDLCTYCQSVSSPIILMQFNEGAALNVPTGTWNLDSGNGYSWINGSATLNPSGPELVFSAGATLVTFPVAINGVNLSLSGDGYLCTPVFGTQPGISITNSQIGGGYALNLAGNSDVIPITLSNCTGFNLWMDSSTESATMTVGQGTIAYATGNSGSLTIFHSDSTGYVIPQIGVSLNDMGLLTNNAVIISYDITGLTDISCPLSDVIEFTGTANSTVAIAITSSQTQFKVILDFTKASMGGCSSLTLQAGSLSPVSIATPTLPVTYTFWYDGVNLTEAVVPAGSPTGSAGGDLSGSYPNPTVAKLQGNAVSSGSLGSTQDGYVLTWKNASTEWIAEPPQGGVSWADDLAGSTATAQYVASISGNAGAGGTVPINATTLSFESTLLSPSIVHASTAVSHSPDAVSLTIQAQHNTGSGAGGDLILNSGNNYGSVSITASQLGSAGMNIASEPYAFIGVEANLAEISSNQSIVFSINNSDYVEISSNTGCMEVLGGAGLIVDSFGTGLVHSNSSGKFSSSLLINADIAAAGTANIAVNKLAAGTASQFLGNSSSPTPTWYTMSGDVTLSAGAATVGQLQGSIALSGTPSSGQVLTATSGTAAHWATPASGFTAGGDLSGTSTSQKVIGLDGYSITPLADGYLYFSGSAMNWVTLTSLPPSGTAGGDLSGSYPNPTVAGLQGKVITITSLTTGNQLLYNGTAWVNSALNLAGGSAYVSGALPVANVSPSGTDYQVLTTNGSGNTAWGAVNLAQSAAITGNLPVGNFAPSGTDYQVLTTNGSGNTAWGAISLNQSAAVSGALPIANLATGTSGQILMSNATPANTWTSMSGDVTIGATGATTVGKIQGVTISGTPSSGKILTATSGTAADWAAPAAVSVISGITVSGTPSSGQVLTATSSSAADWATPGGGGGGPTENYVFQPGGTASGNTYTTQSSLQTALSSVVGPVTVYFDLSQNSDVYTFTANLTIPANSIIIGLLNQSNGAPPTITSGGYKLSGCIELDCINVTMSGGEVFIQDSLTTFTFRGLGQTVYITGGNPCYFYNCANSPNYYLQVNIYDNVSMSSDYVFYCDNGGDNGVGVEFQIFGSLAITNNSIYWQSYNGDYVSFNQINPGYSNIGSSLLGNGAGLIYPNELYIGANNGDGAAQTIITGPPNGGNECVSAINILGQGQPAGSLTSGSIYIKASDINYSGGSYAGNLSLLAGAGNDSESIYPGTVYIAGGAGSGPNAGPSFVNILTNPDPVTHQGQISLDAGTCGIVVGNYYGDGTTPVNNIYMAIAGASGDAVSFQATEHGVQYQTDTITTSTYTVDSSHANYTLLVNYAGAVTITMSDPTYQNGTPGRVLKIKDISGAASTNHITINSYAGELFDGASSYVISMNYGMIELTCDATNWFVTGSYTGSLI